MKINCDKCGKDYDDLFDTVVRIDYSVTGRGKPCEFHVCLQCRKNLVNWIEAKK
ncbi:MAG: hypothetical protein JXA91_02760 [Candidatus Thermoplasmatota archaeon]|nr:hypothetical protein [Candidatus Thermoplasmatota archaeon]